MPTPTSIIFVEGFVTRFPRLAVAFAEHVADNDGVLPHVFFGEVLRDAEALWERSNSGDKGARAELATTLAYLDAAFGMAAEVDDVIAVSFVEPLLSGPYADRDLRTLLGPKLSSELRRMQAS